MRTFITSTLFTSAALVLAMVPTERAFAQAAMTLSCPVANECTVVDAPAGTTAFFWNLNGPGGPTNYCGDTDSTCNFACTRVAGMRVSVTAIDANNQALATASRTAGCAPTDW